MRTRKWITGLLPTAQLSDIWAVDQLVTHQLFSDPQGLVQRFTKPTYDWNPVSVDKDPPHMKRHGGSREMDSSFGSQGRADE